MRVVIQRVQRASLTADEVPYSNIGKGIMCMVGIEKTDTLDTLKRCAHKIVTLRIFKRNEKLNDSVLDIGGEIMLISNFTLCTSNTTGARPDFSPAMEKTKANEMFNEFVKMVREYGVKVETGVFGAHMLIDCVIDGPLNIYKEFK